MSAKTKLRIPPRPALVARDLSGYQFAVEQGLGFGSKVELADDNGVPCYRITDVLTPDQPYLISQQEMDRTFDIFGRIHCKAS